ncbi:hypothetical protein [Virgibacillus sp. 6R]|uniref:hypothetical protein n=1 Tax=Metabacillus sp. 22489 TaxID=3453928 RepID=UPI001642A274
MELHLNVSQCKAGTFFYVKNSGSLLQYDEAKKMRKIGNASESNSSILKRRNMDEMEFIKYLRFAWNVDNGMFK